MDNVLQLLKPVKINGNKFMEIFIIVIALLFVALYLYSAFDKFIDLPKFQRVLSESILIGSYSKYISWVMPVSEIATSILLIIPQTRIWGLRAATSLIFLFTLYLGYMLLFTDKRSCSCGGFASFLSWQGHVWLNSFFIVAGITALVFHKLKS